MTIWEEILSGKPVDTVLLWQRLDGETRLLAAQCYYRHDFEDGGVQHSLADAKVATALNFRLVAVRKLPPERRARTIALLPRSTPELVAAILTALHFEDRRDLMASFLDSLGVKHDQGVIPSDHDEFEIDPDRLDQAITSLYASFPVEKVDLYMATLYLGDPDNWGAVRSAMERRSSR